MCFRLNRLGVLGRFVSYYYSTMDSEQGRIKMAKDLFVGVDLGGTKLLAGLFDAGLSILNVQKTRTPGTVNGDEIKDLIISLISQLFVESGQVLSDLAGICVAV